MHINAKEKFLLANLAGQTVDATTPFLTKNLSADIYKGGTQELDYDGPDAGQDVPQIRTNPSNAFDFEVDFVASGVLGTAPASGQLLQACGFAETVTASTDVTYTKADADNIAALDLEMRHIVDRDGTPRDYLYKTVGAKGQVGLDLTEGEIPMLKISNMEGDYITPSDVTGVDPDQTTMDALKANLALPVDGDNTLVFQLNNKNLCVSSFSCSNLTGYTTERANIAGGCKYTAITAGTVEFTMTFLEVDWTSEFNPYAYAETESGVQRFPFKVVHGTVAGQQLELASDEIQVLPGVQEAEIKGELARTVTCRVLKPFTLIAK